MSLLCCIILCACAILVYINNNVNIVNNNNKGVNMNRELLLKLISEDDLGLLNIDYEIHSGCGARKKIKAVSLRSAKAQATKLGFGVSTPVWIRDSKGKLLAKKECKSNSLWI